MLRVFFVIEFILFLFFVDVEIFDLEGNVGIYDVVWWYELDIMLLLFIVGCYVVVGFC